MAHAPYLPWGLAHATSRLLHLRFAREVAGDGRTTRHGLLLPLDRLERVRWLDEAPEQDDRDVTTLWMDFAGYFARISGARMEPLVEGLHAGVLDFVQEFDPRRWPEPDANGGAPVVWKITCDKVERAHGD